MATPAPPPPPPTSDETSTDSTREQAPLRDEVTLFVHVIEKGAQVGSALGLVAFGGACLIRRVPLGTISDFALNGGLIGSLVCGLMVGFKRMTIDGYGVMDRAYRLRRNDGQLRADYVSEVSALVSAIAVSATSRTPIGIIRRALGGAAIGLPLGYVVGLSKFMYHPNPDHEADN